MNIYEAVKGSARWSDADRQMVDLTIVVDGRELPFTASSEDSEEVGRNTYQAAIGGEFGPIEDYIAPVPVEAPKPSVDDLMAQLAAIQAQLSELQKES